MVNVGQVVVKLNGRFAGYYGVVVELLEDGFAVIGIPLNDKVVKKKKTNLKHIVPVPGKSLDEGSLKEDASLISAFKAQGFEPGKRISLQ